MLDFDKYLMRHGEHGVQYFIELAERYNGIVADINQSLEYRWAIAIGEPLPADPEPIATFA